MRDRSCRRSAACLSARIVLVGAPLPVFVKIGDVRSERPGASECRPRPPSPSRRPWQAVGDHELVGGRAHGPDMDRGRRAGRGHGLKAHRGQAAKVVGNPSSSTGRSRSRYRDFGCSPRACAGCGGTSPSCRRRRRSGCSSRRRRVAERSCRPMSAASPCPLNVEQRRPGSTGRSPSGRLCLSTSSGAPLGLDTRRHTRPCRRA